MLVVISDTGLVKDEAHIINALFDEGLKIFHLRKPSASALEIKQLLQQIKEEHMDKIALHSHHQLANYFCLKRLHYTEENRKNSSNTEWLALKENGYYLSTSIHKIEEAGRLSGCFDYSFFGPVFNSFSKTGYLSIVTPKPEVKSQPLKLIAIGGIDENNCKNAFQMGFDGIAVLGAVWQSANPIKSFQQIKKAWISIAPL